MKKYIISSIIIFLTSISFGQSKEKSEIFIDSVANQLIKNTEIKSLSIGIVKNNKTQIYYYGDTGNGSKPSNSNYYEIASLTKTFTGLLLAQAVNDKKLTIDDDVRKYLKGNYKNLEYNGKPITFRSILTHKSGLPYTFPNKPEIFINPDYDKLPFIIDSLERNFTKDKFFQELAKVKLDTLPGTSFKYSNVGANLTAYILEDLYKMDYEKLLEKYIFKSAKMKSTKLTLAENENKDLVQGYSTKRIKMPFNGPSIRAAGALKSTLPDMLNYIIFQLNEKNEAVKLSHSPIWKEQNGTYMKGYFWQMDSENGNDKIFQNGGSFGTSSWLEFYPKEKIGLIIITNVSGQDVHNKLSAITTKIYNKIKDNN
ncbi:serine hydrolase domain-containing protein [Flavobacterium sp. IMCC34518]|uniref:serine hydrolase domain-containing protein n=1 Tax=Flavobacterium sp. IMCC34518 TaxID=3003623 RepID=UPI0022AC1B71|nr:serine hydrolase domain-containing protein [Flavobacterium sp. IMCC34518]